MALNNNQITELLTTALAQATGGADISALDVKNVIDNGTPVGENGVVLTKEMFTNALVDTIVKYWFKDSSYRSGYSDPFFVDSEEYGAYISTIRMKLPEVDKAKNWNDMGSTEEPVTVGCYKVVLPQFTNYLFGKTVSFSVDISITGSQWDTAFNNASALNELVAYVHMVLDNAIVCHLEDMDYLNRNNFIAEKLKYASGSNAKGIHYINLVADYNAKFGTTYTKAQFLSKKECIAHAVATIKLYSDRFTKMSKLFNTEQADRFTPKNRQVLEVLADFESTATSILGNDSYNYNIVSLGENHVTVPYWQGSGEAYDMADTSFVNLKLNDGAEVEQSGIVAILVDKYAISHTIKQRRQIVKYFDVEDITTTFCQFRDMYATDVSCNGIIFGIEELNTVAVADPEE